MKTLTVDAGMDLELIDDYPSVAQIVKAHRRDQRKKKQLSFRKGEVLNGTKRTNTERVRQYKNNLRRRLIG